MNKVENYRAFEIAWLEPPLTSATWTANVASNDAHLYALMGGRGAKIINGRTRDYMISAAKKYIDDLLD
jgi:hypothetical protein